MSWEVYYWTAYGLFLVGLVVLWVRKERRRKAERAEFQRVINLNLPTTPRVDLSKELNDERAPTTSEE